MPVLDTSNLENLADLCFEDFKALHLQSQNRADVYYRTLKEEAEKAGLQHVVDYAELAGNVVNNSKLSGVLANNFAEVIATKNNIDFSVGSDNYLRMQYELMQADIALRTNSAETLTGELDFNQTNHMHETALGKIGLPPEAFSLYTPLNILGKHDPERAQSLFEAVLSEEGILDIIKGDLLVGLEANISPQQQLPDVLRDYAAQAEWLDTLLEVMQDFVVFLPGDVSENNGRIETYQQLLNLAEGVFDNIANRVDSSQEADTSGVLPSLPVWFKDLPLWNSLDIGLPNLPITGLSMVMNLDGPEAIDLLSIVKDSNLSFDTEKDGLRDKVDWVAPQNSLLALGVDDHGTIENVAELIGPEILQTYFL